MITDLYLVHHSHTDIGYTHPQPVVLELHRRFLDEALDLADATADRTDGSGFRWTVEVSGTAIDWWRHARGTDRDRLVAATQAGRIEVAAMRWNQAHLSDHHMLLEAMAPMRELREAGIPIRTAMNTDVNGVNWGVVDVMAAHGIASFSMAINEHFGHAVQPRPQAFNWRSPSGRELLIYNGLMYGATVSGWLGIPTDLDKTLAAVPRLAERLEQRGYPHAVLIMQATNVHIHDNAAPNPALPDHVRRFNERSSGVKIRLATISEAFDRLRGEDLSGIPTLKGDWPDWWTFGAGSSARETAIALAGQRALRDAQQLTAWQPRRHYRSATLEQRAAEALALYVEHTYTADRAARKPDSPEADTQISWKKAQAYEGYSLARMLRRDGLAALGNQHAGDEASALVYNPLPFPVRRAIRVPTHARVDVLVQPVEHFRHRQDVEAGDVANEETRTVAVELPALGYALMPLAGLRAPVGRLSASDGMLRNDRIEVRLDSQAGGARSLVIDGTERIDAAWDFPFGVPVLESPDPALRATMFEPPAFTDFERAFDLHRQWQTGWAARREAGRLEHTTVSHGEGEGAIAQTFRFSNGDTVTVTYRLSPGDEMLTLDVVVNKVRLPTPHAIYLPLPLDLRHGWKAHYETAGAVVELDREQLPGSSRHFVTTQRFLRLQDEDRAVTVASPDLPLFQVGGFTFGRHDRGEVIRDRPVVLAWLNNNYWDTNFEVTQSGPIRSRLTLLAHAAEPVSRSMARALAYVVEPQLHLLRASGPATAQLMDIATEGLLVTGMERDGGMVRLWLLNPDDVPHELQLGDAALRLLDAKRIDLDGHEIEKLDRRNGGYPITIAPRDWTGVAVAVE
jgi:alpha-mannosidase